MINITELLNKCFGENKGRYAFSARKRSDVNIQHVVRTMIPYIGQRVLCEGVPVQLSWEHVGSYLESRGLNRTTSCTDLYTQLLMIIGQMSAVRKIVENNLMVFKFEEQQTAYAFLNFTSAILPIRNAEYPKINNTEFILTEEQYSCCELYAMQRSGEVSTTKIGDHYFLKTLRADTLDYSYAFILGIMPGNGVTKRQNLRYVNRGNYTVNPKGKVTARINKQPMYTTEQKKGFYQIQSCTYLDSKLISPAFGFTKERNRKLYGLMTHRADALVNRMLVSDGGTVGHVFDCSDFITAQNNHNSEKKGNNKWSYSHEEMDKFKVHNLKARPYSSKTNECLARLRFNICRSIVTICSDTLESRLLAYDFAQELLAFFADYAEKKGFELNPNFRIPIVFYTRKEAAVEDNDFSVGGEHELRFYTEAMHAEDQKKAVEIYNDSVLRNSYFDTNNFEFMLGLPNITSAMLTEEVRCGLPLVMAMIRAGYVRMLGRLLRGRNDVVKTLCREMIDKKDVSRNDSLISQLILAEAFDIAEELLVATKSNKYNLLKGNSRLSEHLIRYGNPRQLNYMEFDKILLTAAEKGAWVTIILCVKEYPDMDKGLLGQLLYYASQSGKYKEAELLLKMGADRSAEVSGLRAIQHAVEKKDWAMVAIFALFPADKDDFVAYGFALLKALEHEQPGIAKLLLLAGAKPTWRKVIKKHELESALYYAVKHGFDELLPDLIKHETECEGGFAISRRWLAVDLAVVKKNEMAMKLLAEFPISDSFFLNRPDLVCKLVVEALAIGNHELTEYRLLKHLTASDLVGSDGNIILNGFRIIQDHLQWACSHLPLHYKKVVLSNVVEILLKAKELVMLKNLITYFRTQTDYYQFIDDLFFGVISKKVSADNIGFIKDLINGVVNRSAQRQSWQFAVNHALCDSLNQPAENVPYLLLELGAEPDYYGENGHAIVEKVVDLGNETLLRHLLENYCFSKAIKNRLLTAAVNAKGLTWLALELVVKYKTPVQSDHAIASFVRYQADLVLAMLDAIDKKHYYHHSFRAVFYSAWVYGYQSTNKMVCNKLMSLLGPTFICHLVLLRLSVLYKLSLGSNLFCRFSNLKQALSERCLYYVISPIYGVTFDAFHENVLGLLNNYFSRLHQLPEDDVIVSTYETISGLFKQATSKTRSGFFGALFSGNGFEKAMHRYFEDVDSLISTSVPEAKPELSEPLSLLKN